MKRLYEIKESTGDRKYFRTFKNLLHHYGVTDKEAYNRLYQRFQYNDWYLSDFIAGEVWRRDFVDGV